MANASISWMLGLWFSFDLVMSLRFIWMPVGLGFERRLAFDVFVGWLSLILLMAVVLLTSHVVGWVRRVSVSRGSRMWRFRRYFLQRLFFVATAFLDQRLLSLATAFSGVGDVSFAQKGILD